MPWYDNTLNNHERAENPDVIFSKNGLEQYTAQIKKGIRDAYEFAHLDGTAGVPPQLLITNKYIADNKISAEDGITVIPCPIMDTVIEATANYIAKPIFFTTDNTLNQSYIDGTTYKWRTITPSSGTYIINTDSTAGFYRCFLYANNTWTELIGEDENEIGHIIFNEKHYYCNNGKWYCSPQSISLGDSISINQGQYTGQLAITKNGITVPIFVQGFSEYGNDHKILLEVDKISVGEIEAETDMNFRNQLCISDNTEAMRYRFKPARYVAIGTDASGIAGIDNRLYTTDGNSLTFKSSSEINRLDGDNKSFRAASGSIQVKDYRQPDPKTGAFNTWVDIYYNKDGAGNYTLCVPGGTYDLGNENTQDFYVVQCIQEPDDVTTFDKRVISLDGQTYGIYTPAADFPVDSISSDSVSNFADPQGDLVQVEVDDICNLEGTYILYYTTNEGHFYRKVKGGNLLSVCSSSKPWHPIYNVDKSGDPNAGVLIDVNNFKKGNFKTYVNGNLVDLDYSGILEGSITTFGGISAAKSIKAYQVHAAVFNDYAEYRHTDSIGPGRCVVEVGDGSLELSTKRMQLGANITSDTFGFSIGETRYANTPIAVCGRVLAYPYEPRETYKPGEAVCSGPDGTVSKMHREEIRNWPDAIVGYVSEIPDYDVWGTNDIKVDGRIWIKVK